MNSVISTTRADLCIGCGICAGICPKRAITMDWDSWGELKPQINVDKCVECGLCLKTCSPIQDSNDIDSISENLNKNQENIKYETVLGFYLENYVGHVNDESKRMTSASGGIATWVLKTLLEKQLVDYVILVGPGQKGDRLFEFKILKCADDVESCASSVYYPVEISQAIEKILENEKDELYAIIALPCVIQGLRYAQIQYPILKKRIKFLFSMVCGQLQNAFCTEYLSVVSGVEVDQIGSFHYRRKNSSQVAANFCQVPIKKDGNEGRLHYNLDLPYKLWKKKYFTYHTCDYCDDVFAELADCVFMDAWLPSYSDDWRGHTITVIRNSILLLIIKEGIQNKELYLENIMPSQVIESQAGRVNNKRTLIQGRLYWLNKKGVNIKRRIIPLKKQFFSNYCTIRLNDIVRCNSKIKWNLCEKNTEKFEDYMYRERVAGNILDLGSEFIMQAKRALKRLNIRL